MKKHVVALVCAAMVAVGVVTTAAGQQQPKVESTSTLAEILAELRALRAELNQATGASLRAQLLVARLALQEQRITVVGREIAEIQEKLQTNERTRPMANWLKTMMSGSGEEKTNDPQESNPFLEAVKNQASELDKNDEELKARYAELSRLLADEQSRWMAFNAQLEALEKMIAK